MSCCSGWAQWLCYASSPSSTNTQADRAQPQGRAHHKDRVAELERAPPAAPEFWQRQGLRPHVVISTKFQEPWYTYSQDFKVLLMELGCTVYNPNTDNAEVYKEEANDRWLRTFNENLEQVKRTKGFVLQVQQGVSHEKSHMQVAEERQSRWLNVPRIAVFAFEGSQHVGGSTLAKTFTETALAKAEEQWTNGVAAELQMCSSRYEPVDGADKVPTNSRGNVHGMAKCTWPNGNVYVGEYQNGKKHGRGTFTWASGAVYVGQFQHDVRHGRGKFTNAKGDFSLGFYVDDKPSGEGVKFSKDRQKVQQGSPEGSAGEGWKARARAEPD